MTSFSLDIPTVETERLMLRAAQESDLDVIADFMQSERSHFVGGPLDRASSWKLISGNFGHWVMRGFGMWYVHHKGDDRMIGACGFIFHEGWDEPELAWHVHDGYEGAGYAFEAASAARAYGAKHFGLDGVISYIDPSNTRSAKLATRLGASYERDGGMPGTPLVHVYRHPKSGDAK